MARLRVWRLNDAIEDVIRQCAILGQKCKNLRMNTSKHRFQNSTRFRGFTNQVQQSTGSSQYQIPWIVKYVRQSSYVRCMAVYIGWLLNWIHRAVFSKLTVSCHALFRHLHRLSIEVYHQYIYIGHFIWLSFGKSRYTLMLINIHEWYNKSS